MGSLAALGKTDIKTLFWNAVDEARTDQLVRRIATVIPSDQATETHKWPGVTPAARKWLDDRVVHSLPVKGFSLSNDEYELTIEIPKRDRERAKNRSAIEDQIAGMGQRIEAGLPFDLAVALLLAGESTTCYDGPYFFSASHTEDDRGTQSNLVTTATTLLDGILDVADATDVTPAEASKVMLGLSAYVRGYKDNRGKVADRNAKGFLVLCGTPMLYQAFSTAVHSDNLTSGERSAVKAAMDAGKERFEVIYVPELSSLTAAIIMLRTGEDAPGRRPKALILQEEGPIEEGFQGPNSPEEFWRHRWVYGANRSLSVGFWDWRWAIHATMA